MSDRFIILTQVMIEEVNLKGSNIAPSLQGHNKAPSGHQPQGAEAVEASEEDTEISPEDYTAYSAVKIRAIRQEHVRSQFRSKKRSSKLRHTESAEAGLAYYFMLLSLHPRVRR
jgi:hypothetical protein